MAVEREGFRVELCDGSSRVEANFLRVRPYDPVEINTRGQVFERLLLESFDLLELDLGTIRDVLRGQSRLLSGLAQLISDSHGHGRCGMLARWQAGESPNSATGPVNFRTRCEIDESVGFAVVSRCCVRP